MRSSARGDTPPWLPAIAPACGAIAALLAPYGEVVVHELATDRIVAMHSPAPAARRSWRA